MLEQQQRGKEPTGCIRCEGSDNSHRHRLLSQLLLLCLLVGQCSGLACLILADRVKQGTTATALPVLVCYHMLLSDTCILQLKSNHGFKRGACCCALHRPVQHLCCSEQQAQQQSSQRSSKTRRSQQQIERAVSQRGCRREEGCTSTAVRDRAV